MSVYEDIPTLKCMVINPVLFKAQIGGTASILGSYDGINWINDDWTSYYLNDIIFDGTNCIACGNTGKLLTLYTSGGIGYGSNGTINLYGICYANSLYVLVGAGGVIYTKPSSGSWTTRASGTSNDLYKVTYFSGLYVTVGANGTILTSPDGTTWTSRTSGTANTLYGITYNANTLVAVGASGTILTSPDGINWTMQTSGTANTLRGIKYCNSIYISVGDAGTILTSPDGTTWTAQTSGTSNDLYGAGYFINVFIAFGTNATILTSPDMITWTTRNFSNIMSTNYIGVAKSDSSVMCATNTNGYQSTDGIDWSINTTDLVVDYIWTKVRFVNKYYCMVGEAGAFLYKLEDATEWTSGSTGRTENLIDITYGNGYYVAIAKNPDTLAYVVLKSSDLTTWDLVYSTTVLPQFYCIEYINAKFLVGGACGLLLSSSDLSTFSIVTLGTGWTTSNYYTSIFGMQYLNDLYIAVGYYGLLMTSPDGTTWTKQTSGVAISLYDIIYANELYIAVGASGTILTSPDGTTWTKQTSGTTNTLEGVVYGNGLYVSVGYYGTILTSPDGTTWTKQTSGVSASLYDIIYANELFIAVGASGTIITSPDGITWTTQTSGTTNQLNGIAYGNEILIITGGYNTLTSSNGIDWTLYTNANDYSFTNIVYGNGVFILRGSYNTIATTYDGSIINVKIDKCSSKDYFQNITFSNNNFYIVGNYGLIMKYDVESNVLSIIHSTMAILSIDYYDKYYFSGDELLTATDVTSGFSSWGKTYLAPPLNSGSINIYGKVLKYNDLFIMCPYVYSYEPSGLYYSWDGITWDYMRIAFPSHFYDTFESESGYNDSEIINNKIILLSGTDIVIIDLDTFKEGTNSLYSNLQTLKVTTEVAKSILDDFTSNNIS